MKRLEILDNVHGDFLEILFWDSVSFTADLWSFSVTESPRNVQNLPLAGGFQLDPLADSGLSVDFSRWLLTMLGFPTRSMHAGMHNVTPVWLKYQVCCALNFDNHSEGFISCCFTLYFLLLFTCAHNVLCIIYVVLCIIMFSVLYMLYYVTYLILYLMFSVLYMLCYIILCNVMLYYVIKLCYVMLPMFFYFMLCYVMLCYVCYVILCYVILCYVIYDIVQFWFVVHRSMLFFYIYNIYLYI